MKAPRMLMLCALLAAVLTATAWAEHADTDIPYAVTGGNIWFDASAQTITDCDEEVTEAVIPQSINGVTVTEIGIGAFNNCSKMRSIELPDTLIRIRFNAFMGCLSLDTLTVPKSVKSIAAQGFYDCGVTHVTLLEGITGISAYMLCECSNLESVSIPVSVKAIAEFAFDGSVNLRDIYYAGTPELWESIAIDGSGNQPLENATIHYLSDGPENPGTTPPPEVALSVPSFGAKLPLSVTGSGTRTVNFAVAFYGENRRFIGVEFLQTDIYPRLQSVFVPVSRISVPTLTAFALDNDYRPLSASAGQSEISGSEFPDRYAAILSEANSDSRNALIDALTEREAKDFVRQFAGWMR